MIKKDWRFKKNQTIKCFQNILFGLNWNIFHTRVLKVHLISKTLSIEPNKKLPFCAAKPYKPDYTVVTARAPVSHLLLLLPTKCHMLLPQHQVKEMNHRRSGRSFFLLFSVSPSWFVPLLCRILHISLAAFFASFHKFGFFSKENHKM